MSLALNKVMQKGQLYTILLLITILVVGISFSCSKSPKCWGDDKNKGIIESSVRIDCEPISRQQEYIINDDSTFLQTFTDTITEQLNCTLPVIDFNNYSLLGFFADGQCEVKFIKEVSRQEQQEKYHYKLVVKSCGACKSYAYSYNWVSVPKIPDNWTVTFKKVEN